MLINTRYRQVTVLGIENSIFLRALSVYPQVDLTLEGVRSVGKTQGEEVERRGNGAGVCFR